MVVESFFGGTSAEKRSFVSSDVARIAFAIVRTTCGSTSVENADEKSVGTGITSWGAGIRLSGGMPYRIRPPIKPAPITQIDERSGKERYRTRSTNTRTIATPTTKKRRVFEDKTCRRPEEEQGKAQSGSPARHSGAPIFR